MVVAVDVSEDLNRWLEATLEQDGLGTEHLLYLLDQVKDLLLLDGEGLQHTLCLLAFLGLKEVFDKNGVKVLVLVLDRERRLDIGSQLLGLLL